MEKEFNIYVAKGKLFKYKGKFVKVFKISKEMYIIGQKTEDNKIDMLATILPINKKQTLDLLESLKLRSDLK